MNTSGTVFDIGYQRYDGVREGRSRSVKAIFKDGVRTTLGFGRGGRAKILPWFFIGVLTMIGLVMAIIAGAANLMGGPGGAEKAGIPSHGDYYGIASIIVFVFAAVVGPELLCPDRRNGTINLYLVRPLLGSDYAAARWGAFFAVMLGTLWLPQVVLFLGRAGGEPSPGAYVQKHWLDVPRFLLAGAAMAAYATSLSLLIASFTKRRAYASVFMVGLFVITTPFTVGLASEMSGRTLGELLSLFALSNIPLYVGDVIFGKPSEMTDKAPAQALGAGVLVGWYFLWTFGAMAILWRRYRRLTP